MTRTAPRSILWGTIAMDTILVTGGTGQVGGALVERLAAARPGARVVALSRGPGGPDRLAEHVAGDIERDRLGLAPGAFDALAASLVEVYHCAAATRFDLPLDAARRANVRGTRNVLALAARAPRLGRFHHVSTAYVASGRNSYEISKAEAEAAVRASGLPFTIWRPSVIVGDSRTGRTRTFNVLYYPMRLAWHGRLPALPCAPGAAIDIVPVDAVAGAIATSGGGEGATLNLVSGRPIPIPALAELLADALDRARAARGLGPIRRPALVPVEAGAAGGLAAYLPYLAEPGPRFEPAPGFEAQPLERYIDRVVAYAVERDFGARPARAGWAA